jgi:hypothetical protein
VSQSCGRLKFKVIGSPIAFAREDALTKRFVGLKRIRIVRSAFSINSLSCPDVESLPLIPGYLAALLDIPEHDHYTTIANSLSKEHRPMTNLLSLSFLAASPPSS